ncbi:MAG: nickel pincer cofactor biosynthesis protein LarC [Deltaproteobacteria bacterium]|nr:nickel pincer cofactor biosynthesis protein LarC [Deltaproteobacteria bacterium]
MKVAYFDAFSGLSGDMTVGALLHLGVSLDALRAELAKLPLTGYRLSQMERWLSGIRATKFDVAVNEPLGERSFRAIARMLQESALIPSVKETALRIFTVLAEAEGRVHGIAPGAVHFHEVGAVDSIVDIVGTAFGLHALGIEKVYASALPMGKGLVPSRHGVLPVPAPATVELLKGLQVRLEDGDAEMVTPTGAAIIAAVAQQGALPQVELTAVGYGAGERTLPDRPNLLRVLLGNTVETPREEQLLVLETNIDDLNPELYEHVMERLFAAGARDVFLQPIQMKKNRPGVLLWVLGEVADREKLSGLIFAETSTLGIRSYPVARVALRRESKEVVTPYGSVRVKLAHSPDGRINMAPEYEDCKRLAREKDVPLKIIYEAAVRSARES